MVDECFLDLRVNFDGKLILNFLCNVVVKIGFSYRKNIRHSLTLPEALCVRNAFLPLPLVRTEQTLRDFSTFLARFSIMKCVLILSISFKHESLRWFRSAIVISLDIVGELNGRYEAEEEQYKYYFVHYSSCGQNNPRSHGNKHSKQFCWQVDNETCFRN